MAYSADTFVADEQPTTAKWNKLWSNDASFNDGTGIGDNAIDSRHYVDGSIDPEHLATNTIKIASAAITGNISTTSTSFVDATGLTTGSITVPSGGRDVLVMFEADRWACSTTGVGIYAQLLYDATVIGTYTLTAHNTANGALPLSFFAKHTPSSGSHTYKLQWKTDGGTLTMTASATSPATILAMNI